MNYLLKATINKKKYIYLSQCGGSIKGAQNNFHRFIITQGNKLSEFVAMLNRDEYLKDLIKPDANTFTTANIAKYEDKIFCILISSLSSRDIKDCKELDKISDTYFAELANQFATNNIDWLVKSYIGLTIPKIEDLYKVIEPLGTYKLLQSKKKLRPEHKLIDKILGLTGLEALIATYDAELKEIKAAQSSKLSTKMVHKKVREEGENPEARVYTSLYMDIYMPTTKAEAIYYGKNTKWCTAAMDCAHNMFDQYNKQGKLYIIEPKNKIYPNEKYQLHFESKSYMDDKDKAIDLFYLIHNRFKEDNAFNKWIASKLDCEKKLNKDLPINNDIELLCYLSTGINIKSITFGELFNQPVNHLPESLQTITFGNYFNQPIDNLPKSLQSIRFSPYSEFNKRVDNLPASLQSITFGNFFNQPVNHLPKSLQTITFGYSFDQPVDHLPESLKTITFGDHFDQPVDHLPRSLQAITFGDEFNQRVDKLPESLQSIEFNAMFNKPVKKLPRSLQTITFGQLFNQSVNELPKSLQSISFSPYSSFNQSVDKLPESLHSIIFGEKFNQSINALPDSVQTIIFDLNAEFDQPITKFPKSLTQIRTPESYPYNKNIPPGVQMI
jgi:hypothetical protein